MTALRTLFAGIKEFSSPVDPARPEPLAVGRSGVYDLENATDDDILRLAEDLYQQSREESEDSP